MADKANPCTEGMLAVGTWDEGDVILRIAGSGFPGLPPLLCCSSPVDLAYLGAFVHGGAPHGSTGVYVPPVMLFPRVRMKPELLDGSPPGSIGHDNKSGWITAELFECWFDHFVEAVQTSHRTEKTKQYWRVSTIRDVLYWNAGHRVDAKRHTHVYVTIEADIITTNTLIKPRTWTKQTSNMEDYFQCVWDLLPFWQENHRKRASEPPCENAEFAQIEEALYGMSGCTIALLSLVVGWHVTKAIWRRLTKQQVKQTIDKEEVLRSLCIDAHVAELWKLKAKKWKRNNGEHRRVRKMIRELKSKLRKAHHKEKRHIRKLKRLQRKQHDSPPHKNVLAKMAELESRLLGAVHEKEGLTGLLLAAEEKYMARDRNAQEYWFALQMVGKQIQDIKTEASTLRTRLKAFEPQSPHSMQAWATAASMFSQLRQQKRNNPDVRVHRSQSSPTATVKQTDTRVNSIVRDIIDGSAAAGETMQPVTSDEVKPDHVVDYSNWCPDTAHERFPLATKEHLRMRMKTIAPMLMSMRAASAAFPAKSGAFLNCVGAIDAKEQAHWPLPGAVGQPDCQKVAPLSGGWGVSPGQLTVIAGPKIEPAGGDKTFSETGAYRLECIPEQSRQEATEKPDSPRAANACGPTSPLTAYMYPIMELLDSDTADAVRSSTSPPFARRDLTGACPYSDSGKHTSATDENDASNAHAEPDSKALNAYATDDMTAPGVSGENERRRHYSTRRSHIPPPQVFSR
ncbi:hypothetical protein LSAT2_032310 [Lamellibrachia satsuma]|nr:hypothetical protein LSAT2_032310 [Lamellibrachia satsuma]